MAAVIGILLLYLCSKFDINTIEKYIIIIFIVILVTIQFMSFIKLTIHNYIGNYMDKQLTLKIEDQIKNMKRIQERQLSLYVFIMISRLNMFMMN